MTMEIYKWTGVTIYKNKHLTHMLQQPFQKANSIINSNQPRKPACYKSDLQESRLLSLLTIKEAK